MAVRGALTMALLSALPAGCAVGPDFKRPAPPPITAYTPAPLTGELTGTGGPGGAAQRFDSGREIPADWWTLFHCGPLNSLIEQALANNHDLKAAQAALVALRGRTCWRSAAPTIRPRQAASRRAASGNRGSSRHASIRTHFCTTSSPAGQRLLCARCIRAEPAHRGVAAGAGAGRALPDDRDLQHADRQSSWSPRSRQASLQQQIDATRELIDAQHQHAADPAVPVRQGLCQPAGRRRAGSRSSRRPPPRCRRCSSSWRSSSDLLAVLAGRLSEPGAERYEFELASLQLPQDLPVSLPSTLVEQRPDVLQAEANLHAASAQIGIAVANRLPNIELTANAGSSARGDRSAVHLGHRLLGRGRDADRARSSRAARCCTRSAPRKAAYVQAAEQYRSTVLTAFQNVADTLAALEQDAEGLKAAAAAADAAKVTLDLAQRQLQDGYAGYLALLSAEQAYQQARINLVQAQANRYRRYGGAVPGAWRRLVASHGTGRETTMSNDQPIAGRPTAATASPRARRADGDWRRSSALAGCSPKT